MFPGILRDLISSMLQASYSMRNKLHTLFMLTAMKSRNARGIIKVNSMEVDAESAISIIV
jgi:hypothetical protein